MADKHEARRHDLRARAIQILSQGKRLMQEAVEAAPGPDDVEDASDMAIIDTIKATRLDLEERDHQLLVEIRAALERMQDGTYGRCIDCDEEIAPARLKAIPWASRCEDDQERFEQEHRLRSPSL